jgi:hypothetical protein
MGLNLYVWHETEPISAEQARTKLDLWTGGDRGVFARSEKVSRFHEELIGRYPRGVWTSVPAASDQVVAASCTWLRAADVAEGVIGLAAEHGLVCYEPAARVLNPNAPGYEPGFVLSGAGVPVVPDPDAKRLDWAVRRLDGRKFFVILDRADGAYAQIGYGREAGVADGTWVLEFRALEHFQARTRDVEEAVRFFQEYRAGGGSWRRRHDWRKLDL